MLALLEAVMMRRATEVFMSSLLESLITVSLSIFLASISMGAFVALEISSTGRIELKGIAICEPPSVGDYRNGLSLRRFEATGRFNLLAAAGVGC